MGGDAWQSLTTRLLVQKYKPVHGRVGFGKKEEGALLFNGRETGMGGSRTDQECL